MQIYHLAEDTESKTIKSFYSNLGKLANVTKTERILINEIYCKKKKTNDNNTVEPLLSGHLWDLPKCPLNRGCPLKKGL